MARINNTDKYSKNTEVTKEDFAIGTQASTGKTINIKVEDIVNLVPSVSDNGNIKEIKFKGENLPKINKTVEIPSKLSEFDNDIGVGGGKIDNISFKGSDLPVVDKRVDLPSDLSDFTDKNNVIPDTSNFVNDTQVQNKIEDWSIKNIETIDKLKQEVGKEGQKVRLLGYYSVGDKPELLYEWKTGLGEDDGGSVINSTGGRWEALFGENIDVRDFGAKEGEVFNVVNFQKYINTITNKTITFLKPTEINSDLVIPTTNSIIMESTLTLNNNTLIIGEPTKRNTGIKAKINVTNRSLSTWEDNTVGVKIYNLYESTNFIIQNVRRFNTGVELIGINNNGFVYNEIVLGSLVDNQHQLVLFSSVNGWVNENSFYGGRFANTSTTHNTKPRYGIEIKSDYDYYNNNNIFYKPSFEVKSYSGVETVIIDIQKGNNNSFRDFRNESNTSGVNGTKVIRVSGDSHTNIFQQGYGNFRTESEILINNSENSTNYVTNTQSMGNELLYNSLMYTTGNISEKCSDYNPTTVYITGDMFFNNSNQSTKRNTSTVVKREIGYLELPPSRMLNFTLDTSTNKKFIIHTVLEKGSEVGRIGVRCYDSEGNNITTGQPVIGQSNIKLTYNTSALGFTTQSNQTKVGVEVGSQVDKVDIIVYGSSGSNMTKLKRVDIYSTKEIKNIPYSNDKTLRTEAEPLNKEKYNKGTVVYSISKKDYYILNDDWESLRGNTSQSYPVSFGSNYSQNPSFGQATLDKKGNEVFYKMFANKSTNVEVGDTVFTLQPELRPKNPEFIVGHGGNGSMVVWLMVEPTTGAVKVQEFPTGGGNTIMNAIVMSGSFFIRE